MSKNIVFLGIKHCGKSTHGKLLARKLAYQFLDTDDMLVQAYKNEFNCQDAEAVPRAIMQKHGEEFFRKFEASVIRDFAAQQQAAPAVIALGGGVPCNDFLSISELKSLGTMVYLSIPLENAFKRIAAGGIPPFLQGDDPKAKFMELCKKRIPRYNETADVIIEITGETAPEIFNEYIYNTLKEKNLINI